MDCELAERIVSKVLDGEAAEDEVRSLEQHCESCAACREYRAGQATLHRSLERSLGGFLEALRPRARRRRAWWRRVAGIAAVLALMTASVLAGYSLPRDVAQAPAREPEPAARQAPESRREKPTVSVAESEDEVFRQVVWDPAGGLRSLSRVDSEKMYLVRDGDIRIQWSERDSRYRLASIDQ